MLYHFVDRVYRSRYLTHQEQQPPLKPARRSGAGNVPAGTSDQSNGRKEGKLAYVLYIPVVTVGRLVSHQRVIHLLNVLNARGN
jgi:hypothetical protein